MEVIFLTRSAASRHKEYSGEFCGTSAHSKSAPVFAFETCWCPDGLFSDVEHNRRERVVVVVVRSGKGQDTRQCTYVTMKKEERWKMHIRMSSVEETSLVHYSLGSAVEVPGELR